MKKGGRGKEKGDFSNIFVVPFKFSKAHFLGTSKVPFGISALYINNTTRQFGTQTSHFHFAAIGKSMDKKFKIK